MVEAENGITMKRPLILHIGTPKTGTTSLQGIFAANRSKLLDQGVIYPTAFGSINLAKPVLAFAPFRPKDPFFKRHKISSTADQVALQRKMSKAWRKESAKAPENAVAFVSNEHLYTRMRSIERLHELRSWLIQYFDPIRIVVGLRPQIDLLVSNASQMARLGRGIDSEFFRDVDRRVNHGFLNYRLGLAPWQQVFGAAAITPIPFKRNPDIVKYFSDDLGGLSLDRDIELNTNPALGWRAIAVSNMLLLRLKARATINRQAHAKMLASVPDSPTLQVGIDLARLVTEAFRAENAVLAGDYSTLEIEDFEPNWEKYSGAPNLHLIDEVTDCFEIMNTMVAESRRKSAIRK